jgi:hypothetical protein
MPAWPQPVSTTSTPVSDPEHKCLIVEDERVGLPGRPAQRLVTHEPSLEWRRAVDLAGHEDGAVEKKRRLPLFHDREADALECGTTCRGKLGWLQARYCDPAATPELRVDEDRKVAAPEHGHDPFHARDVIPVPVAEHDRFHVGE